MSHSDREIVLVAELAILVADRYDLIFNRYVWLELETDMYDFRVTALGS